MKRLSLALLVAALATVAPAAPAASAATAGPPDAGPIIKETVQLVFCIVNPIITGQPCR